MARMVLLKAVSVFVLLIEAVIVFGDFNYCQYGEDHVACNPTQKPSECDQSNSVSLILSPNFYTERHNHFRNLVARGDLVVTHKIPAAHRMSKIEHNKELEFLARLNVDKCIVERDVNFRTAHFEYPGQNLISKHSPNGNSDDSQVEMEITALIRDWYNEHLHTELDNQNQHVCLKTKTEGTAIDNFKNMMRDKAKYVGCAARKFFKDGKYHIYLVCNYSYGEVPDQVYAAKKHDQKAGHGCIKGLDQYYKSLCDEKELVEAIPEGQNAFLQFYNRLNGRVFSSYHDAILSGEPFTIKNEYIPAHPCPVV